jgi:hypothetical protein
MAMPSNASIKVSVVELSLEHLAAFNQALLHVLSSNFAERTFAQIADGLPTKDIYGGYLTVPREEIWHYVEPCPGSVEAVKAFRRSFQPNTLELVAKVLLPAPLSRLMTNK